MQLATIGGKVAIMIVSTIDSHLLVPMQNRVGGSHAQQSTQHRQQFQNLAARVHNYFQLIPPENLQSLVFSQLSKMK